MPKKLKWSSWWLVLLAPLGFLLTQISKCFPELCENVYARGIYPVLSQGISYIVKYVPFSVAELLVIAAITAAIVFLCLYVYRMIKPKQLCRKQLTLRVLKVIAVGISCGYFAFVVMCGINYNRYEFTYYSGLTVREHTTAELEEMCVALTAQANHLAEKTSRNADGTLDRKGYSFSQISQNTAKAFSALAQEYEVLRGNYYANAKPVIFSQAMSYMQISGVFFPFTYEPNVNCDIPYFQLPVTMAHEMVHLRGFMREDEANFIAYLACLQSEDVDIVYSGVMSALLHATNQLYAVDQEAYLRVAAGYSDAVLADFRSANAFWAQYETKFGELSTQINDAYLKANNQTDGVQSYGRMVDLLLAKYEKEKGE